MKSISELSVKLFADGADRDGILDLYRNPAIKGFTTNPTLILKAAQKPEYHSLVMKVITDGRKASRSGDEIFRALLVAFGTSGTARASTLPRFPPRTPELCGCEAEPTGAWLLPDRTTGRGRMGPRPVRVQAGKRCRRC